MAKHQARDAKADERQEAVDATIFDQEQLRQYTGDDLVLQRELVTLFLNHFAPVRMQLETASSARDWKFAAHSLKGSARSIGAPKVAALAEKLDAMDLEGLQANTKPLLDELDAAMAAFAAEVKNAIG